MLVGLGHDLQELCEFERKDALRQEGYFFTKQELDYCQCKKNPLTSLAGIFSAKEAFYKALPSQLPFLWTDLELTHTDQGAPKFEFKGELRNLIDCHYWQVSVSISHSGNYASAVVMILQGNEVMATL